MSIAMPNPLTSKPGGSVSIFGRKVSYDALLLAAASLAGVFFLYKIGQAGTPAAFDTSSIDPNAGSAGDFATVSTQPQQQPAPGTAGSYWGLQSVSGGTLPAIQPSTVPMGGQPAPARVVQFQGLLGSGGGPNTTGRSSGPQISGRDYGAAAGGGSGGHAPTPASTISGTAAEGGSPAIEAAPPSVPGPAVNAQGQRRGGGGQIV